MNSQQIAEFTLLCTVWLSVLFFAILFLQSGVDKVVDRKGNLEWLTGHFSSSPLVKLVPMLLSIITLTELGSGLLCAAGAAIFWFSGAWGLFLSVIGLLASLANLMMLFFGQRMAKDYAGASTIAVYFCVNLGAIYFALASFRPWQIW